MRKIYATENNNKSINKTLDMINSEIYDYIIKNNIVPIKKALFKNAYNISPNILTNGGGFYFYFIFTLDKTIIFELDLNLNILNIREFEKEYYEYFYIKKGTSTCSLILKFKDSKKSSSIYSNVYTLYKNLLENDPKFENLSKFLLSQNFVEDSRLRKNKPSGFKFLYSIYIGLFVILGINCIYAIYTYLK